MKRGYVQVYTGNGKGKTTAAIGLTMRASGASLRVCFVQFIKGLYTSEMKVFEKLNIEFFQGGRPEFIIGKPSKEDIEAAKKTLEFAREKLTSGDYDLVVLDELNVAVYFGLVKEEEVLNLMDLKANGTELVITGRYATPKIINKADLVTEMREIKHYYTAGVEERVGIER